MLPVLIATRAAFAMAAVMLAVFAVLSARAALGPRPGGPGDVLARAAGATLIFAIPVSVAFPIAIIASALLIGIGAPPLTYVFILFGALMSLRAAVKHPDGGMEGCTKLFGLSWSGYAIAWSLLSFHATGGLQSAGADLASLRWLQPPLAALPFALLVLKLAGKKRNAWLFLGALVFLAAAMSLIFFPVENGFARGVLPDNDWLRFPLVGLAVAAALMLLRLISFLRLRPDIRRARRRALTYNSRFLALLMIAFGLAWAAARSVIGALA